MVTHDDEGFCRRKAATFINEEKGILTVEDAINGAVEIIAEWISDEAKYRKQLRQFTQKNGVVKSVVKKEELDEKKVYEMYYDYEEPVKSIVPHRVLALNRAEKEDVVRVTIEVRCDKSSYKD